MITKEQKKQLKALIVSDKIKYQVGKSEITDSLITMLDKALEARGLHFTRYADDTIILVKSEKAANRVMESITHFIEKKLGLKVNMTKTKICKPNDLKYLGFGFYKGKEWNSIPHIDSKKNIVFS